MRIIAQKIYGADDIELEPEAQRKIERYKKQVRSETHHILQENDLNGKVFEELAVTKSLSIFIHNARFKNYIVQQSRNQKFVFPCTFKKSRTVNYCTF